ncbi:glutathione S-transferase family protein [Vibrio sonorensis]|uniref:glutathione S-transferase family protein n=1 Tax=Vibrio sonorensis TaxID=1004316 RepID=UPI0008D9EDEE|nr:glutathione S-transferase family protein [Vibrio sonorensis]
MYQLYYYPNNASLAPHLLLHYMELEYQLLLVDRKNQAHKSQEYLKLNPAGRISTLVYQDRPLFESPAICIFLCEQHPEHKLIPPLGTFERAEFFQWLAYLNNTLQSELMVRYYPHRHTNDEKAIPAVVEAQDERIGEALQVINDQLQDKTYLLGNTISACDFFLFMLAQWSLPVKRNPMTFDRLADYLARLAKHPTVMAVCEKENIDLTPFRR